MVVLWVALWAGRMAEGPVVRMDDWTVVKMVALTVGSSVYLTVVTTVGKWVEQMVARTAVWKVEKRGFE